MTLRIVYPGMEHAVAKSQRLSTWLGLLLGTIMALLFVGRAQAQQSQSAEFHKTYPLTANGHVSVGNVNGQVHITGWDRNEVKVDALKLGETQEDLDNAEIVVDAQADNFGIKTKYRNEGLFHNNHNNATVEYTISIPKSATLDAHVVNSRLEIAGITGPVSAHNVNASLHITGLANTADLATVNSSLDAQFDALPSSGTISAKSVNGGVMLRLPASLNAEVSAKTVNGHISNDFGVPVDHGRFVGHSMNGTVGSGGLRIELHNVNGGIDLRRQ